MHFTWDTRSIGLMFTWNYKDFCLTKERSSSKVIPSNSAFGFLKLTRTLERKKALCLSRMEWRTFEKRQRSNSLLENMSVVE